MEKRKVQFEVVDAVPGPTFTVTKEELTRLKKKKPCKKNIETLQKISVCITNETEIVK